MSSKNEYRNDFVIKKKRRRTAVDPCLGYYRHNEVDLISSALKSEADSVITSEDSGRQRRGARQRDVQHTDSVEAVTSPLSESAEVITVEEFLRQQATSSIRRCRTTYTRKRWRRIQFSSDDEDQNYSVEEDPPEHSSTLKPDILPVAEGNITNARINATNTPKTPCRPRKERKTGRMTFSERMQRAAALSSVDPDAESPTVDVAAPLLLVSHDQITPVTPPYDKRAKLVNPRVSRQLDTSFAYKENHSEPCSTMLKICRPFSQWRCSYPQSIGVFPTMLSESVPVKIERKKISRTAVTPLKLVSYEEHDEARAAIFDLNSCRKHNFAPGRRDPLLPASVPTTNIIDDPFVSLPHLDGPFSGTDSAADIHPGQLYEASETKPDALPNLPGVLIPKTSSPVTSDSAARMSDTIQMSNSNQDLEGTYSADDSDAQRPALEITVRPRTLTLPSVSQKPMRLIGTMLEGFRERARSVLISQSQKQLQEKAHTNPPLNDEFVESRRTTRRSSSRRIVVSSPVRHPTPASRRFRTTSARRDRMFVSSPGHATIEGGFGGAIKNVINMPSVSAVLRQTQHQERQNRIEALKRPPPRRPRLHRTTDTKQLWSELKIRGDEGEGVISGLGESVSGALFTYNSGCPVPNLFDLLESVEAQDNAGCGARIILSPSV